MTEAKATEKAAAEFNPWKRKRPARKQRVVELRELGLSLTFLALDVPSTCAAMQETQDLVTAHITGEEDAETSPAPYLAPDGRTYPLSEALVRGICVMRHMQPEKERKGFAWWLGLALNCPEEFTLLSAASQKLNAKSLQAVDAGNSSSPDATTGQ